MQLSSRTPSLLDRKKGRSNTLNSKDRMVQALVNKLIAPTSAPQARGAGRLPTNHELSPIVHDSIKSVYDAENALAVLPDLNLAAEIQISSILSTKDLITTSLVYDSSGDIPLELRTDMVNIVKEYFRDTYKLQNQLYDILYDVLYRTGSYAVGIIPESSVDALINGSRKSAGNVSLESHTGQLKNMLSPVGILGSAHKDSSNYGTRFGLESLNFAPSRATVEDLTIEFKNDSLSAIRITDNADITKVPWIQKAMAAEKVNNVYGKVAAESFGPNGQYLTDRRYYHNPLFTASSVSEIKTAEDIGKPSVGRPLTMHWPSESVITIHTPGDYTTHIGYIVVLDNIGNPITKDDLVNSSIAWSWMNGTADTKIKRDVSLGLGLNNDFDTTTNMTVSQLTNSYAEFVETKVINAIKNGIYGDTVAMSRPQDVYRIMMARSLAKKGTQLLYVPVEQMVYFAIDYNKYGIGRSLLERNKMLTTMRTVTQFATLNGTILNNTRNFDFNIQLDPSDRQGEKTIEDAKYRVMQGFNNSVPFTGTPDDMWAYMTNAGISFSVEGNDFYPSTKTTMSDNSPDYKIPDSSTEEDLAKRHYRGFGLDPELIISPESIEFASQVTTKNLLASQRICKTQEKINPKITQFVKTYIVSDGILMKELGIAVREFFPEESKQDGFVGKHINELLRTLSVTIPSPDVSMLGSQMEQFDQRSDALDKILQHWIADDFEGLDVDGNRAREILKSHLMRNWMRENDIEPELIEIFDNTEDRNDLIQTVCNDAVDTGTLIAMLFNRMNKRIATVAKNQDLEGDDGGSDYDSGESDSGEDSGDDSSGDDFGGDDFDSGMDDTGDDSGSGDDSDTGDDDTSDGSEEDTGGEDEGASDGEDDGAGDSDSGDDDFSF